MITVGETYTLEAIHALEKYTPYPYELVLWYDACGRKFNENFLNTLLKYTKNVIVSYENQGIPAEWGYALLYMPYDYIIMTTPDCIVKEGYFERLSLPFETVENMAVSGECWHDDIKGAFELDKLDYFIDGTRLYSKEAINAIGSINPSFKNHSCHHLNLDRRFYEHGWHVASVNGVCSNGSKVHDGKFQLPDWEQQETEAAKVFVRLETLGHDEYDWWRSDMGE